jgi:low affinity Fe/Cu permease
MHETFTKFASAIARVAGNPIAFALCCLTVVAWGAAGPVFGFSDTWQLIINTGTTIVTFLMVFLIQNTQNRDGAATQAKLDEIIEFLGCDDAIVGLEHLTDTEIEEIRQRIEARSKNPTRDAGRRQPDGGKGRRQERKGGGPQRRAKAG